MRVCLESGAVMSEMKKRPGRPTAVKDGVHSMLLLPAALVAELDAVAEGRGKSRSALCREILQAYIDNIMGRGC